VTIVYIRMVKVIAEYVWIGGNFELHSKTRILDIDSLTVIESGTPTFSFEPVYLDNSTILELLPSWDYDGSSTSQASGHYSEIILKPRAVFTDPFRSIQRGYLRPIMVLCSTYNPDGSPQKTNNRDAADKIFESGRVHEPWFGMEQEYFFMNTHGYPLGYDYSKGQGQYYCSVGAQNAFGRKIVEEHLLKCTEAGVKIAGVNAEVAPGQWEYQIGPCVGIEAGDHLWMARYIMERVGENHGVSISIEPKPLTGDWNGSGCHTNFSTAKMRAPGGISEINEAIRQLETRHAEHMQVYGENNECRLTGKHETADFNTFSSGVGNRGASVRIGTNTFKNGCGYFEDRRPSSNMDPYLVTSKIFDTSISHEPVAEAQKMER